MRLWYIKEILNFFYRFAKLDLDGSLGMKRKDGRVSSLWVRAWGPDVHGLPLRLYVC
jgi:hypothetical protein